MSSRYSVSEIELFSTEYFQHAAHGRRLPCSRRLRPASGAYSMPAEIAQCLNSNESRLLSLGDAPVFLRALTPPVRVIIVGATHVGQVLADLANRIGYDDDVVDPRAAFASGRAPSNCSKTGGCSNAGARM
jgi:xanthine/CO dehydrogenase XdhC/CoxF family maturation factor